MFNSDLVAVIKNNGKILREKKDLVYLPFGSEYSILIKNLHCRDALINIWIDGAPIFNYNSGLIVKANSMVELERFYNTNNRFKFIEKTKEISDYRGDRIDDGIIRIEYQFEEKELKYYNPITYWINNPYFTWDQVPDYYYNPQGYWITVTGNIYEQDSALTNNYNVEGITVKGSKSDQNFIEDEIGDLEDIKHSIVLKLKGYKGANEEKITEPILVTKKLTCETCGKSCNSKQNYCDRCGTALF